ncbi:hypothetical protein BDZ97DRAFT_168294 [Flammula alnicola]|nr:hypothetical protein BDZ97DRAFT_168294 [Flammula alnicola]
MSRKIFNGYLLALIVFPPLSALAVHFIWGRFKMAGLGAQIGSQCQLNFVPHPGSPQKHYFTPYTGLRALDGALCPLVAFFDILMGSPDALPFLAYGIGNGLPLVLLPIVESYRVSQSHLVAYPAIWGLITQVATLGVIFPVYWLAFILTGGVKKKDAFGVRSFTQAQAQAIVFGIIVGSVIPSVAMLTMNDFYLTAIWQFYPAFVAVAQLGHLQFNISSKSGYGIMQALYLGCFMISSSVHIATVWPIINDFTAVRALLIPMRFPLPPSTDISFHLLDFLKWDIAFAYSSTALAMLWFANSTRQVFKILLWYVVAIPLFGFGAAVMGVAIWRDGIMG